MFYSSLEFSYLAADKTEKLLYTKNPELQRFLTYLLPEETLNDLYQKEGPDAISQAADERAPAASSSQWGHCHPQGGCPHTVTSPAGT